MISARRLIAPLCVLAACLAAQCGLAAGSALASPRWLLDVHHDETNFPPGGTAELSFDIRNIGESASSGTTTLHVSLPAGITFVAARLDPSNFDGTLTPFECRGATGKSSFSCTTTAPIYAGWDVRDLLVTVAVPGEASGSATATATLSGGGAPEAPPAAGCEPGAGACTSELIHVSAEPATFGIVEDSWVADFYAGDEATPVRQAGSHPAVATFSFDVNSVEGGFTQAGETEKIPAGSLRDVEVDLPPGFVGAPTAAGECAPALLASDACSPSSLVGRADVTVVAGSSASTHFDLSSPIFNMEHSAGTVTDLGFTVAGKVVHIDVSLDPANNYSIRTVAPGLNEVNRVMNTKITIWGVPGDASHDLERANDAGTRENPVPIGSGIPVKPFLTLPAQCESASNMTLSHYDSWQHAGVFGPPVSYELPGQFTGCDLPRFEPELSVEPTSRQADAPTGLSVHLHVPQNENPDGLGTPPVKETVVRLPEGMSFSPSVANGLSACSLAQIKLGTNDEVECPDASRIGEVVLSTPLLAKPLEGSVYLASQYDNPFGSLFALYLVLHDNEERGLLIKLAGKVEADPVTGQITTTFADTPQLPFEDLTLKFRSGARAPLVNPPTCGAHEIGGKISSWARPGESVALSSSYQVTEGAGGAPCPPGGILAFNPTMVAGTVNNLAGSYSPLYIQIDRNDGEQQLTNLITTLPPGVTANLSGVAFCPDADIALARTKTGAQQEAQPSCPAGSQIGHTTPEVGVGAIRTAVHGRLYLAGPYQGAPFSVVEIDSAVVGPYDLGTVVNRLPLSIDPYTAQATAGPNPEQIPHIIKGVIVHLREAHIQIDRPNFILNATSCDPMNFSTTLTGSGQNLASATDDVPATVTNRYQAADCASLAFKPDFKVATSGKTSKANGASLTVKLAYPNAPLGTQANIHLVKVELPKQLPSRLTTLQKACTAAQFALNPAGCPAASVVGHAKAVTPILPVPLEGPAYFVSHGGEAFPSLILVLQGYGITIDLVGTTFINKQGITSSTFKTVPDQPVSSFELTLPEGPFSALTANGDLCSLTKTVRVKRKVTLRIKGHKRTVTRSVKQTQPASLMMPSEFVAQNGVTIHQTTPISVTGCTKAKPIKKKTKHTKKAKRAKRKG